MSNRFHDGNDDQGIADSQLNTTHEMNPPTLTDSVMQEDAGEGAAAGDSVVDVDAAPAPKRRSPLPLIIGGVAVLVVLGGGAAAMMMSSSPRPQQMTETPVAPVAPAPLAQAPATLAPAPAAVAPASAAAPLSPAAPVTPPLGGSTAAVDAAATTPRVEAEISAAERAEKARLEQLALDQATKLAALQQQLAEAEARNAKLAQRQAAREKPAAAAPAAQQPKVAKTSGGAGSAKPAKPAKPGQQEQIVATGPTVLPGLSLRAVYPPTGENMQAWVMDMNENRVTQVARGSVIGGARVIEVRGTEVLTDRGVIRGAGEH